jgi:hypothetical protein
VQLVGFPTRIGGRVTGERADPPEDVCDCQQMWPIWGALITAGLTEIVLILVERRTSSPMLPLELFSSSTFSAANVVGLLLNGWILRATLLYQSVLPADQGLLATAGWPCCQRPVSPGWPTGFPGVSPPTRSRWIPEHVPDRRHHSEGPAEMEREVTR